MASALSCLCLGVGCAPKPANDYWLWVSADPTDGVKLEDVSVTPTSALIERRIEARRVALHVRALGEALVIRAPGACPVEAPTSKDGRPRDVRLGPLFDLGPRSRSVGPDTAFTLEARPRCAEASAAKLELHVTGGAPLAEVSSRDGGRVLVGRTRGLGELGAGLPFGIVPVSAARRGTSELGATLRLADGTVLERSLEVSALTRANGLPNIPVDHAVLLAGASLRLSARPESSHASLSARGELWELRPDVSGAYLVRDEQGHRLDLDAGRFDEIPLDCGRADCHRAITQSAHLSPMQRVLANDLGGTHPLPMPECALACHATGEPGTADGGFTHVLGDFPALAGAPATFEELPRALRRLGGVTCLACHGPGHVPEISARWAVLRSDTCAVCHDLPPRYGHVAALASSRMAASDRDARTRDYPACARCHTTWGALGRPERMPPAEAPPHGITCVACHDVHPAAEAHATAPVPALLRAPLTRLCARCHEPVDALTRREAELPSPHATQSRGCLTCHDSGPETLALGQGHAFKASLSTCARCHAEPMRRSPALGERARTLFARLSKRLALPSPRGALPGDPPHANPLPPLPASPQSQALRDVLLVLEDPAADVHNPKRALYLLERAETAVLAP